jgi:hypothetical protein
MNKFQKLAQLNRDIELLENAGKIKAAQVLHQKFIKEAQFAMPMTYNPFMVNPLMYSMMSRPVVNPAGTAVQPTVQPTVQTQTVQPPATQPPTTPATNPQPVLAPPATTSTTTTPPPASGQVNPSGIRPGTPPSSLTRNTNQQGDTNQQGNKGFMQDGSGKIYIIDDNGNPKYVAPPGSTVGQGLSKINPGPPTPTPVPTLPPGSPPNARQNQLGNHFRNKIENYFNKKPKPDVQDQYTFIGNLENQLRKYRDEQNLTQQQYDELSNGLYVR